MSDLEGLAAAVASSPEEPGPLLVWADALLARAEPLGEFISASFSLTRETEAGRFVETRKRAEALLAAHRRSWLGGADVADEQWRWGLLRRCALRVEPEHLFQAQMASEDAPLTHLTLLLDELVRLRSSPAGRFLEGVALQLPAGLSTLAPVAAAVAQTPTVHELVLSEPSGARSVRLDAFPTITRWRLLGVPLHPATTLLPSLERLELLDAPLFPGAEDLLAAPAPHLRTLGLGDERLEVARLLTRLTRATHPALRRLSITDDLADDVLLALADSPLLAQLDTLEVQGPFTDEGLRAVSDAAARFDRLQRVSLVGGGVSASVKKTALKRLPRLEVLGRKPRGSWTGW
ncbi:MAG: hypothetical protein JNJ54_13825 [Myxococcaceae bacterium]|nr:hypothetical protein [Myxococcaceae bacterium]